MDIIHCSITAWQMAESGARHRAVTQQDEEGETRDNQPVGDSSAAEAAVDCGSQCNLWLLVAVICVKRK